MTIVGKSYVATHPETTQVRIPRGGVMSVQLVDGDYQVTTAEMDPATEGEAQVRGARWEGTVAFLDEITDEMMPRLIHPDGVTFNELPMPLMAMFEDDHGTGGDRTSILVGRIEGYDIVGSELRMNGTFEPTPEGLRGEEWAAAGTARVSVDTNPMAYRITAPAEVVEADQAELEAWLNGETDELPVTEDGRVIIEEGKQSDYVFEMLETIVMGVTMVPFSAFADAMIGLVAGGGLVHSMRLAGAFNEPMLGLTASAASMVPVEPPRSWFADPGFTEPTPLHVSEDGRVSGHVFTWGQCHTGFPGKCVQPPASPSNYAWFKTSRVLTAEGEMVWTGPVTLGTDHPDTYMGADEAQKHYADTGWAVADVTIGEDEIGAWISGALRPDCPAEKVRALRGSTISPDWRWIDGDLETIGLLACNGGGYPIPQPEALVADGQVRCLVASGMLRPEGDPAWHTDPAAVDRRLSVLVAKAHGVEALAELANGETARTFAAA